MGAGLDNKGGTLFGQANQTANEAVQELRTVHSYNLQARVTALYRSLLAAPNKKSVSNALFSGAAVGASQVLYTSNASRLVQKVDSCCPNGPL